MRTGDEKKLMTRYSEEVLTKRRKLNQEKFVNDARKLHGQKFDYSRIQYLQQKVPVEIGCPKHGAFFQTPDKHLQAAFGCPTCGIDSRAKQRNDSGRERFYRAFNERFGLTLELISPYVSVKDPIVLRCKLHDETFTRTPDSLNSGATDCPKCVSVTRGLSTRLTQSEFIARATSLFGDQFDFSNTTYKTSVDEITFGCMIHGAIKATASNFLSSKYGCPKCGRLHSGFAEDRIKKLEAGLARPRPTTLALMKVVVFGITAFKLGITSRKLIDRYALALREVIFEVTLDELDALKIEQHLHGKYLKSRDLRIFLAGLRGGKRWGGDSEIYKEEAISEILRDLKIAVVAVESKDQDYWQRLPGLVAPQLRIKKVKKIAGKFNLAQPVIRLDTKEVFASATAAALAIGATQTAVSGVCAGRNGKVKGIRFALLRDYESGDLPIFIDNRLGANHVKSRVVRCIETGTIYGSIAEAAEGVGAFASKITLVCQGKRATTGGFRWEYVSLDSH